MSISEKFRPDTRAVAEKLRPLLNRMETARQAALAKRGQARMVAAIITAIFWITALLVGTVSGNAPLIIFVIGGGGTALSLIIYGVMAGSATGEYVSRFKEEVFAGAVEVAVPGMTYQPSSMVPQASFERGDLFNSRITRYEGEDCFSGKFGATDLIFSELHVQRKDTSTNSEGHTTTHWVTVFKGIYLIADFHKDFACKVRIEPDVAEATFGWLGRKMQGFSGDLVRLENPEFERAFKVTSDDAVGARYLLTPDMQERFLALRGDWSADIRATLLNSCLHLAIPMKDNWFETSLTTPADDLPTLHSFLVQLMIILKITETLDLNTRVWTKE